MKKRKYDYHLESSEIDELRQALFLNKTQFAELITSRLPDHESITRGGVSHWIAGRRKPEPMYQRILIQLWDETFRLQPA